MFPLGFEILTHVPLKTSGLLTSSGSTEMEHWREMGRFYTHMNVKY